MHSNNEQSIFEYCRPDQNAKFSRCRTLGTIVQPRFVTMAQKAGSARSWWGIRVCRYYPTAAAWAGQGTWPKVAPDMIWRYTDALMGDHLSALTIP